ncbi:tumor necrosis factor receptor superfamily-like protein [Bufonid herpesvirus 1]|uniref:tumor necrosis factor receptor superfamily-like protein n=1 Tax=Bufonid herpesvirus 1 TaxID=2282206 RepID=UPI000EB661F9|nr:tumor necrosis factor receptor superfamily-like protein [Bufonid herpesvirus 1]AXF48627.1 tumor necrosis factor receptor superfamily-like protein [Bufonid herpesvirus 1]
MKPQILFLCACVILMASNKKADARTCTEGSFLNSLDKKCYDCPYNTWQASRRHSEIVCNMCTQCKPGYTLTQKCTPTTDTVCMCRKPFVEKNGFCMLFHKP